MEQRINRLMTFAEVQCSGRAEGVRWGSTAVPCQACMVDSSIKSQRTALCRQTCCALVSQYNQDISENRTLVWCCRLTPECRYWVKLCAEPETGILQGTKCRCLNLDECMSHFSLW